MDTRHLFPERPPKSPGARLALGLGACLIGAFLVRPTGARELTAATGGELQQTLEMAQPGDVVLLADGRYPDLRISFRGAGAEGRPITLRAAHPGKAVLTGSSSVEMRGQWLVLEGLLFDHTTATPITVRESQQCRVTGCALLRCNPPDNTRLHWIRVAGGTSRANRIDHCYTEGKLKDGVVVTVEGDDGKMPQETRIDHNHFKEVTRAVQNGMETIRIGTSQFGQLDAHAVVELNLFEECSGDAEIISSKSCANVYRYNTFRNCDGGVVMRHGHRSVVEGNFFFGNGRPRTAGIRVHGSDHRVLNNYLEGLGQFSLALPAGQSKFVSSGHEPTVRCVVAHNTVVEPAGPALVLGEGRSKLLDTPPEGTVIGNNLLAGSRGTLIQQPFAGETKWGGNLLFARGDAKPGDLPTGGIRVADPKLERGADGLWRPATESPIRGAAIALPFAVPEDLDGQPRTQPADVGADQYSASPIVRRPLRPADVGPAWLPRS